MRAWVLDDFGGPTSLRLGTVADPEAAGDALLVRVGAIGVNVPDLLTTRGELPELPELPAVLGREIAGTVMAAPPGVSWQVGDRVAGYLRDGGGYAELANVPLDQVMAVPDGADLATGAALVVNYQTAYFALVQRGRLAPGESVLVLGAGGGVGSAAVGLARSLGARVVAGVAGPEQVSTALDAGATETVELTEGFARRVRELTGGGVDLVVDPLGGALMGETLRCLAPGGRHLVVGFAAGSVPSVATNRLLTRNVELIGVSWTGPLRRPAGSFTEVGAVLADLYKRQLLRPVLGARSPWEQLPEALERLARAAVPGKAVVELNGGVA